MHSLIVTEFMTLDGVIEAKPSQGPGITELLKLSNCSCATEVLVAIVLATRP